MNLPAYYPSNPFCLSSSSFLITSLHHFWFVFIAWRRILKEKIASKPISLASRDELSLEYAVFFQGSEGPQFIKN